MVERQLIAAANGNVQQQKAFEQFILDETLYVATPEAHADGFTTLQKNTNIQLLNVQLHDGRQATAVFTSPERISEFFGGVGYMAIQGRVLFEMIRAQPAILNPGQTYGVVWETESLVRMLGLPIERVVEKDTQVMLGSPADPPTELVKRLTDIFSAIPQVDAAWLALAAWPDTKDLSWYLDVRTETDDHEPIRRALPAALEGIDLKGRPLDMVINKIQDALGAGITIVENRRSDRSRKSIFNRIFG